MGTTHNPAGSIGICALRKRRFADLVTAKASDTGTTFISTPAAILEIWFIIPGKIRVEVDNSNDWVTKSLPDCQAGDLVCRSAKRV